MLGDGVALNVSAARIEATVPADMKVTKAVTVMAAYQKYADSSATTYLYGASYNNTASAPVVAWALFDQASTASRLDFNDGTTQIQMPAATGTNTIGDHIAVGTIVTGTQELYVDGTRVATGTTTFTSIAYTATSLIGSGAVTGLSARTPNFVLHIGAAWNRVLSAAEIQMLNEDPFCFLTVANRIIPSAATAVVPSQPRNIVATPSASQASVAFIAPTGQLILEELFTGASGAPSANWATTVVGGASVALDTDRLKIITPTNASEDTGRALLIDIASANVEIAGQITLNTANNTGVAVMLRGSGVDVADQAYHTNGFLLTMTPSGQIKMWRIDTSTATQIDTDTIVMPAGDTTAFRFGHDGTNLRGKAWNISAGVAEPSTYRTVAASQHSTLTRVAIAMKNQTTTSQTGYYDNVYISNFTDPGINLYRVTLTPVGGGTTYTNTGASSPIVVTGAPSGPYTATVEASNNGGATWGPASFASPAFTVGTANTMNVGGGLGPAAALARLDARLAGGAILPTSVAAKLDARLAAGAVAPAAALAKLDAKLAAGALEPASTQVGVKGKALSAAIAPAGTATTFRTIAATLAGGLVPAGALAKLDARLAAGTLTPAGAAAKLGNKANAGALTPAGSEAGLAGTGRSFGGGITPSATLALPAPAKTVGGTLTPAGGVAKFRARALAGGITPFGTQTRLTRKSYGGTIAPGSEGVPQSSFLTGTLAPAGSLRRFVLKAVVGSLAPAGTRAKAIAATLDGGHLTPASTLIRTQPKTLAGAIEPAGALAQAKSIRVTLAGALTPLAPVVRAVAAKYGAVLGTAGALRKADARTAAGAIAPAGAIVPANTMVTSGAVVPTADLLRFDAKATAGVIAPIGDTPGDRQLHPIAEITPAGSVQAASAVSFESDMFLAGEPARQPQKATGGTVAPAGAALVEFGHFFAGVLAPIGDTVRNAIAVLRGDIAPTGTVSRPFPRSFAGSLSPSSILARLVGSSLDPVLRRPLRARYDDTATYATYTSEA